jgi:tetratricopeptide (TPR) repeat protein
MRESLSKRTRPSAAKTAARSSRTKTSSSPKRGASRPATAVSPKRRKAAAGTKKAAAPKKSAAKKAKPSTKKAVALKTKPKPKVKLSKVKFKSSAPARRGKTAAKTQSKIKQKTPSKRLVSPPPPPPEPPRRQVSSAVLRAFEHAVKVFNRRQFAEAKPLFESLQHRYPEEVEINARAQTYIHVCNQKLARPPSSPRDADELYDRGVVALNIGDFTQARTFFEKALRLRPDAPHVLYSLAATHAQSGAPDQALDYLTRSIQMQPRFRTQAMNDMDFSGLREDRRFLELLGITSPFDLLESRH